jgi:DNA polymerase III subunit epsilon
MREIIFDTETTGLDNKLDRVIEIGGVELENHFPTGKTLHLYINPGDRKVHPDALAVHGITDESLKDKPSFAEVADEILEFFGDARWVAHNANFDMGFINAELDRLGRPPILHPMGPNSLDALCRRYGIDNSHRTRHGALLDSELLAEVYIEMLGGRQAALGLGTAEMGRKTLVEAEDEQVQQLGVRPKPLAPRLTEQEQAAHAAMVATMGGKAIWAKYEA